MPVVEDLALELNAAFGDGTLPADLGPSSVWVQPDGRLFLIDGLRKGQYPPALNSGGYTDEQAKELKDWAREQIAKGPQRD